MLSRVRVKTVTIDMNTLTMVLKGVTDEGQDFAVNTDINDLMDGTAVIAFARFNSLLNKFVEARVFGKKSPPENLYKGA